MSVFPASLVLPPRTLFARGSLAELPRECAAFGPRGLIVCGRSFERSGGLQRVAGAAVHVHAGGEPTVEQVQALREQALAIGPDWVAGIGGGSVLDLAKAAAGLLEAPLPVRDYHRGATIPASRLPFVAVPTTAGTGSEVTIVSVLTDAADGLKQSIRHASFMPRLTILDADLLDNCPRETIAASGMDALTQAIEAYLSRHATDFTDACALQGVAAVASTLLPAFRGERGAVTERLLAGSALAGLAFSNARLGLVHGLAHPLGARYGIPHGLVCAVCLPHVLRLNRPACAVRYRALASAVGCDIEAFVERQLAALGLASPFAGAVLRDEDAMVRETLASGSTAANPRPVADADAREVLRALFLPR